MESAVVIGVIVILRTAGETAQDSAEGTGTGPCGSTINKNLGHQLVKVKSAGVLVGCPTFANKKHPSCGVLSGRLAAGLGDSRDRGTCLRRLTARQG